MIKKKGFFSGIIAYQLKYGPAIWWMVGGATLFAILGMGESLGALLLFGAFAYIWWHFAIKHVCRFFYAVFVDGDKTHPWPKWLQ